MDEHLDFEFIMVMVPLLILLKKASKHHSHSEFHI